MLPIITCIMLAGAAIFVHGMFHGAPFLPAKRRYVEDSLDMLDLQPGQHLLELGSGDGRVLAAAARRGIRVTGYEINPLLYIYSRLRTWRYRKLVRIELGSYWNRVLPAADGIYTFLLQPYMQRLDDKLSGEITQPTKLLSFIFRVPGREVVQQRQGIYLYDYPA